MAKIKIPSASKGGRSKKTSPAPASTGPAITTGSAVAGATARSIPSPPSNLASLVRPMKWDASTTIHRIHPDAYASNAFNPGPHGNARFSPISDVSGKSIPTIYGGTTFECAAMETVFHDVPVAPGLKSVAKRKLKQHQYSQLKAAQDLKLADLSSTALRNLGITRTDLIESDKDIYPQTRSWAAAIHAQCPDIQGLSWVSRQDDTARALILFEDRLPANPLQASAPSQDIVEDTKTYADLIALADRIGVKITGK